jgi:hypothetical protein
MFHRTQCERSESKNLNHFALVDDIKLIYAGTFPNERDFLTFLCDRNGQGMDTIFISNNIKSFHSLHQTFSIATYDDDKTHKML